MSILQPQAAAVLGSGARLTAHQPSGNDLSDPPAAPPTGLRYGVLGYLCALSFILYIDRSCIGKAAPSIEKDLGISHTLMGFAFGAFTLAYALFEMPAGRWGDRHGSRGVLTRIVLWWSLFTALTGCVWSFTLDSGYALELPGFRLPLLLNGFVLLLAIRFLFGAGQAGALPNSARVIAHWFPEQRRGPAQGLITTSALVGGAVAPVLAGYLIELVGWRLSFVSFGAVGVVWALAFFRWFRDHPAEHPGVNEAERRLIAGGSAPRPEAGPHPPIPWRAVLASGNLWLLGGVGACTAFVSCVYMFWYPSYLEQGRGTGPVVAGWLAGLVLAGGALGALVGGHLGDALVRRTGSPGSRRLLGWACFTLAAAFQVAGVRCDPPVAAALFTALAYLCVSAALASWWAVVTDVSGKHLGALFGLVNSLALPGAVGSSLFFGSFVDWRAGQGYLGRGQWDPAFHVCAAVLLLGSIGWLLVDPAQEVVKPAA
jgi:MFS family permease